MIMPSSSLLLIQHETDLITQAEEKQSLKTQVSPLYQKSVEEDMSPLASTISSTTSSSLPVAEEEEGDTEEDKRSQFSSRPRAVQTTVHTSVRLQDTETEGRPSIYLFIFVNPLSGDQKGGDLVDLPIQHFRLRRLPQVQVEIHNILDKQDREIGFDRVHLIENMVKMGRLPAIIAPNHLAPAVRCRHIHVWSAGGDGTVMSVFEMLVAHKIDLDLVFFSCIPFGTGNDFSQVLGWGRTLPHGDAIGLRLSLLEQLVIERLERADAARLDIWQVEMTAHASGYVRLAGPSRRDGHDVVEVKETQQGESHQKFLRKMCNYMSIGVQGYVGSGFEKHRAGKRLANILIYTIESAKWVFWRRFPPVTHFISRIVHEGKSVLEVPCPNENTPTVTTRADLPFMTKHPIDFVIQNIPHIWGREVDLWGDARSGLEVVQNRSGPTDPRHWKPQRANDGRMEIMAIQNLYSYLKKLTNIRDHVSRIGQFETPFEIHFRDPRPTTNSNHRYLRRKSYYIHENVVCIMCDGEFYILKDPKSLKFTRFAQIWTLGRSDEKRKGRLVLDEQQAD